MRHLCLELNLQREAYCNRTKRMPAKLHEGRLLQAFAIPNLSAPHTQHYVCSWVLVSFPKPTGCLALHLPELFTIFWQPSAVSQSEMSAPLSSFKKTQHFLPVPLERSAHRRLLLTVSCILVSIAVTVCAERKRADARSACRVKSG